MEPATNIKIECKKEILDRLFKRAKPFVNDIALEIKEKGLYVCVLDDSKSSMYECIIKKELFKSYEVPEEAKIGIDLKRMTIPLYLSGDELEIEYLKSENKLRINNYKNILIDVSNIPPPKVPTILHPVKIKTDKTGILKKIISVASKISNEVEFYIGEDKKLYVRIRGNNDELAEPLGEVTEINEAKYPISARFTTDLLENTFKDLKEEITIFICNNAPIKIIEEMEKEKHTFLIAPRV